MLRQTIFAVLISLGTFMLQQTIFAVLISLGTSVLRQTIFALTALQKDVCTYLWETVLPANH